MKDCTTCKHGFIDEQLGFPTCHHPLRFSEECVAFNMHEEKEELEKATVTEEKKLPDGLEEAAIDFADNARKQLFTKDYAISSIADYDHGCIDGFKAGAEWQKEQDQKTIELAEDHAMLAGMNKMEQQMMEKAVKTQILTTSFINLPKEYLHQNGIQAGDKVKVIVIPNTDKI